MARTFVALDIETTGLDPDVDRITEVAAVCFNDDGDEIATFERTVNPGREVSAVAEALTGLSNKMLTGSPDIQQIAPELAAFAGGRPLVGHNVAFDLAFLARGGCALPGVAIDTAALARVLLPSDDSHRLSAVADRLGIGVEASHRALADARTAAKVLVALLRRAEDLSGDTRIELARLAASDSLTLAELIAGAGWESVAQQSAVPEPGSWSYPPPLARVAEPEPPDTAAATRILLAGRDTVAEFEQRTEQLLMAETVGNAFARGGHHLIEAGTGVGKSLAYLVPAALHSLRTGERVVISTSTLALQGQLIGNDVPTLQALLRASGMIERPDDLRVAVLKGRGNYLCYRRWLAGFTSATRDPDFDRLAARVLLWLQDTATGDRSELNLDRSLREVWSRFSAEGADCLAKQHRQVREGRCFLARARREAEAAHIVIVNHALLLADIATGRSAIPAFEHLIVDEAHNLEDQATRQFGRRASLRVLDDLLGTLWRPQASGERPGGAGALLRALTDSAARDCGEMLVRAVEAVQPAAKPLFDGVAEMKSAHGGGEVLVTKGLRGSDEWSEIETRWGILDQALENVSIAAAAAAEAAAGGEGGASDPLADELGGAVARIEEFREDVAAMAAQPGPNDVVWLGDDREGAAALISAPLDVGSLLSEQLFAKQRTVIATSATLSAAGSMRFTAERLGLAEAETLEIGSPFDYERCALLADVTDVPDPGDVHYHERIASALVSLIEASRGRALVLFTSHYALRDAAKRTRELLRSQGITVLAQDLDGSPAELLNVLRSHQQSAIFGTASFWEGVDVRGDALSLLVIVRLPFSVPTDPIYRARAELRDDAFRDYALPGAILKFRQGFGRLIRDGRDRGAIAILDRRISSRPYGSDFIRALPACTRLRGPVEQVSGRVRQWLERQD